MATGKQIKHYRGKANWTLADLSEASGVDVGTISALEIRDSRRSAFFQPIATAFGLTVEQLSDTTKDHELVLNKNMVSEPAPKYITTSTITDPWVLEAVRIVSGLQEHQREGAIADLRKYVQNLGPPRNGQALLVAAG